MATIRIEHTDGTVDTLEHLESRIIKSFGETDLGRLFTARSLANQVTLEEGRDEVYLEDDGGNDEFGGRLKDIERDGSSVELVVDSFERDARKAEPTPAGQRRENVADDVLVQEAVDAIPGLSAGTIQQIETGLTFVFSHSSRAKKIRTVEQATPGEVRYNADKTVDYVSRLGQDRSASVTISPGNQNLDGKLKVKENGGQKNVTHLRMLGAGEGRHQLVTNIVPDTDTASYDNKVTYTDHDWEEGDVQDWDTYINKEVTDTDTLEREGLTLIDELNSRYIELEATIKGVDVDLGDTIYVKKPKDNIDQSLRIVEWERIDDKDGLRYDCTLSSRLKTREKPGTKDRKDIQRYNKAFEGSPVTLTAGGGRQPVTNQNSYEFSFYYPDDVEYEHRVNLQIKGLAYRAYSSGAAAGGDHTHSVSVHHPSHSHTVSVDATSASGSGDSGYANPLDYAVSLSGGSSFTETFDLPFIDGDGAYAIVYMMVQCLPDSSTYGSGYVRMTNLDTGEEFYDEADSVSSPSSYSEGHSRVFQAVNVGDVEGDTIEVEFYNARGASYRFSFGAVIMGDHTHSINTTETSNSALGTTQSESSNASGDHTHDPQPGLIEFSRYPSNCDVEVNGQSIGVSHGDGNSPFEATVDLKGQLTQGSWNRIQVTSDTLGHIQANADIDVYRQILGEG